MQEFYKNFAGESVNPWFKHAFNIFKEIETKETTLILLYIHFKGLTLHNTHTPCV